MAVINLAWRAHRVGADGDFGRQALHQTGAPQRPGGAGSLLSGFRRATLNIGTEYLLTSIAVMVLGDTAIET